LRRHGAPRVARACEDDNFRGGGSPTGTGAGRPGLAGLVWPTPVGIFCPFTSLASIEAADAVEPSPEFRPDMERLQVELRAGERPDRELVLRLARELARQYSSWEALVQKQEECSDFQMRERFEWTSALLLRRNQSFERLGQWMKHEIETLRAFGEGRPPPPDPGLELGQASHGQAQRSDAMSLSSVFDNTMDAEPFDNAKAFGSAIIREEYSKLYDDHRKLIELGRIYGGFDPAGKLTFIDQVEMIEDRWDVFFGRFALMNALNPEYKEQCEALLMTRACDVREFRELLAIAHQRMRDRTTAERRALP